MNAKYHANQRRSKDNQDTDTCRGVGIFILNIIGQCGPLLGTRLYPSNEGPFYVKGQSTCVAFMFLITFLAICLRTLLWWENKKLDKKYGTLAEQKVKAAAAGAAGEIDDQKVTVIAEENYGPMYRYVL